MHHWAESSIAQVAVARAPSAGGECARCTLEADGSTDTRVSSVKMGWRSRYVTTVLFQSRGSAVQDGRNARRRVPFCHAWMASFNGARMNTHALRRWPVSVSLLAWSGDVKRGHTVALFMGRLAL
jgi:hypothetical protein